MEIVHKLHKGASTGTSDIMGACAGKSTCSGTVTSGSKGTCIGIGASAQCMDYCLTTDGFDNNNLKKVILIEFHTKPYSSHLGY